MYNDSKGEEEELGNLLGVAGYKEIIVGDNHHKDLGPSFLKKIKKLWELLFY